MPKKKAVVTGSTSRRPKARAAAGSTSSARATVGAPSKKDLQRVSED